MCENLHCKTAFCSGCKGSKETPKRDIARSSAQRSYHNMTTGELTYLLKELKYQLGLIPSKVEFIEDLISKRAELRPGRIFTATSTSNTSSAISVRCICIDKATLPANYLLAARPDDVFGVSLADGAIRAFVSLYWKITVEEGS